MIGIIKVFIINEEVQSRYRSRETSLDAFDGSHIVVGYGNQHSGDGIGNRREERTKQHHKERILFCVKCCH